MIANSNTTSADKEPWARREAAYVDSGAARRRTSFASRSPTKLHNARAILVDFRAHGDDLWARFKTGEGAAVRAITGRCSTPSSAGAGTSAPAPPPMLDEFGRTVDELDRLAR